MNELKGRGAVRSKVLYVTSWGCMKQNLGVRSGSRKAVGLCERFRKGWGE